MYYENTKINIFMFGICKNLKLEIRKNNHLLHFR